MGLQPPEGFTAHIVLDFAGIGSGRLLVHPQIDEEISQHLMPLIDLARNLFTGGQQVDEAILL